MNYSSVMDSSTALNVLMIIAARMCDVSLGTLRTISVMHGRRKLAIIYGFFEVLIWVSVVSRIISSLTSPIYMVAYAFGFAVGNYIGLFVESWIGLGEQVARIFSREPSLAGKLRDLGFGVTVFEGKGMDGPVEELFVQAPRKKIPYVLGEARKIDPKCFFLVENVSFTSKGYV